MNTLFYTFTIGVLLAIIVVFLIYFLRKISKSQLQQIFAVNMVLIITTCIFILLQMQLSNMLNIDPIYFSYFYYIGIVFFPVSLYFTVKIFENGKIKFKPIYYLLFIIPLLSLVGLWTNERFNLFFLKYDVILNNCSFGPLFIINEVYAYLLYFVSIINLVKFFKKNYVFFAGRLNLFLVGIIFPFVLNLLCALRIIQSTVYIAPIASSISIICFALSIFKFQLVDTLPIALSKIVNKISDGYVVLNDKNMITNYNKAFLDIFELNEMNLNSVHFFQLLEFKNFKGLTEKTVISAIKAVKESNEPLIIEKEFKNIHKYLKVEINNLKTEDTSIGVLLLFKDVTQHHQDVETIQTNQSILIEKERFASIGQLISGVAHNLRTPLFSISGATEGLNDLIKEYQSSIGDSQVTIEDHQEIAHDMENWIEKIKEYTSYMSDIITAIGGQASSFTSDTYETFTINEVIKRINILMKNELQQALVTLNISNQLTENIELHGNMNVLIQVLNNLISNSIQSYGGKPNQNIDLEITNNKNNVRFKIVDYGQGIPEEIKDKIFKEIIHSNKSGSTGLGLFVSYSNIKTRI